MSLGINACETFNNPNKAPDFLYTELNTALSIRKYDKSSMSTETYHTMKRHGIEVFTCKTNLKVIEQICNNLFNKKSKPSSYPLATVSRQKD